MLLSIKEAGGTMLVSVPISTPCIYTREMIIRAFLGTTGKTVIIPSRRQT